MGLRRFESLPTEFKFDKKTYWKLPLEERYQIWSRIIADGLGISETEARVRIVRNNIYPVSERINGHIVFPRLAANASLLAKTSPDFQGPRGPRPTMASSINIFMVSGFTHRQFILTQAAHKRLTGGFSRYLLDLKLTASNPQSAAEGVQFSDFDIRNGIFVSKKMDIQTARAIGLMYSCGSFGNSIQLRLTSSTRNQDFFDGPVRQAFSAAFNFTPNQDVKTQETLGGFSSHPNKTLILPYTSKAVRTYFLDYLGFPLSRMIRRDSRLPEQVLTMSSDLQDEFLKYFLGGAVNFIPDPESPLIKINDVSQPLLIDIMEMIKSRVKTHSLSVSAKGVGRYSLRLGIIPSMELFIQNFLNINPRIKNEIKRYWDSGNGKRAHQYIERSYPQYF